MESEALGEGGTQSSGRKEVKSSKFSPEDQAFMRSHGLFLLGKTKPVNRKPWGPWEVWPERERLQAGEQLGLGELMEGMGMRKQGWLGEGPQRKSQ